MVGDMVKLNGGYKIPCSFTAICCQSSNKNQL